jgi:hypothetical protein
MRLAVTVIAAALAVAAGIARAQDNPMLAPGRDVAVTYRVNGTNRINGAAMIRFTYADHDRKVRLDLFAYEGATLPFGTLVYDAPSNRVLSMVYAENVYSEVPATGLANPGLMLGADMQYKKLRAATIAGKQCTEWQVNDGAEDKGTICVTADGVVLRGSHSKPTPGGLEAMAVTYGTPPDSVFQPDPGMRLQALSR